MTIRTRGSETAVGRRLLQRHPASGRPVERVARNRRVALAPRHRRPPGKTPSAERGDAVHALAPIEVYWAFPGAHGVRSSAQTARAAQYRGSRDSVRRVARALTSGAYRRRTIPLDSDEIDTEDFEDEGALPPEARALGRPYFEVLIVDNVTEQQERLLRSNLHRMRRAEDPFIYEAVVVPSLEDALIGHAVQLQRAGGRGPARPDAEIAQPVADPEAIPQAAQGGRGCRRAAARRIRPRSLPADRQGAAGTGHLPRHRPLGRGHRRAWTSAAAGGCSTTRKTSWNCT